MILVWTGEVSLPQPFFHFLFPRSQTSNRKSRESGVYKFKGGKSCFYKFKGVSVMKFRGATVEDNQLVWCLSESMSPQAWKSGRWKLLAACWISRRNRHLKDDLGPGGGAPSRRHTWLGYAPDPYPQGESLTSSGAVLLVSLSLPHSLVCLPCQR